MTHHRNSGGSLRSKKNGSKRPPPPPSPMMSCPHRSEAFWARHRVTQKRKASFPIHSEKRERVSDFNAAARGQHGFFRFRSSVWGVHSTESDRKFCGSGTGQNEGKKNPVEKRFSLCVWQGGYFLRTLSRTRLWLVRRRTIAERGKVESFFGGKSGL